MTELGLICIIDILFKNLYWRLILEILLAFVISTGIWLITIREKDKIEKEPLWVLIKTMFKGGVISIILTSLIYFAAIYIYPNLFSLMKPGVGGIFSKFGFAMFIGISEETAKALAAIWLLRKLKDFDEPVDGIIYGMAVALGFAAIENVQYMMNYTYKVIYVRHFLSVPLHITCGAIWGFGLAVNKFKHKRSSNLVNLFPYIAASAFLHGVYDFLCFIKASFPYYMVFLVVLTIVAYRWGILKIRKLVAISPFLKPDECSECRTVNEPHSEKCKKCGKELPDREEFYSSDEKKGEDVQSG